MTIGCDASKVCASLRAGMRGPAINGVAHRSFFDLLCREVSHAHGPRASSYFLQVCALLPHCYTLRHFCNMPNLSLA
jgi:hypothetical protein